MNGSSSLLGLLLDPVQYERPPLLVSRLTEILSAMPRSEGMLFLETELGNPQRSLHARFVLLQTAGKLNWRELLSSLRSFALSESPVQLIKEALKVMAAIDGLSTYRFCRELNEKCRRPEIVELARGQVEGLLREDRTVFQFHNLIQGSSTHRDPFTGLEQLAHRLNRESNELIVPALRQLCGVELAAVSRLAGLCADPVMVGPLLDRLRQDWRNLPAEVLKEMIGALCRCVRSSRKAEQVGRALSRLFPSTPRERMNLVVIWSLPLLDRETKTGLFNLFRKLAPEEKAALLESVEGDDARDLAPMVIDGLEWESDEFLYERYVDWLLIHGFSRACLDCLGHLKGNRLRLLLRGICAGDCRDCSRELLPYFHTGMENDLLVCLAGGLLKDPDRGSALRAWELLNSGVSDSVLSVLVRRLPEWLPASGVPVEDVFRVCLAMPVLQTEWLVSWSRLLDRTEEEEMRLRILDGIMVLFEKSADSDPLPYVDIFRRLTFRRPEELRLVRDEVQLILNTLLRVSGRSSAGQMLAALLREMERKVEKVEKV